jgi:hypothetical protein
MADRFAERDEFYRRFKFDRATMVDLNVHARAPDPIDSEMPSLMYRPACPECGSRLLPYGIEVWEADGGKEMLLTCWCDPCGGGIYTIMLPFPGAVVMDQDGGSTPVVRPLVVPWVGVHRVEGKTQAERALPRLEQPNSLGG